MGNQHRAGSSLPEQKAAPRLDEMTLEGREGLIDLHGAVFWTVACAYMSRRQKDEPERR